MTENDVPPIPSDLSRAAGSKWTYLNWTGVVLIAACLATPFLASILLYRYLTIDRTLYAPGFSEAAFNKVYVGQSLDDVRKLLGEPMRMGPPAEDVWDYGNWRLYFDVDGKTMLTYREWLEDGEQPFDYSNAPSGIVDRIKNGLTQEEALNLYGEPEKREKNWWGDGIKILMYTHAEEGGRYSDVAWKRRELWVNLKTNQVAKVVAADIDGIS